MANPASSVRVTGTETSPAHTDWMSGTDALRAPEEKPESQRVTLPSPQPFPRIARCKRSPGEYRLVNGEPEEAPQTRR